MEEYAENLRIIIEEKIEKNEDIKLMFSKFVKDAIKRKIKINYETFKKLTVAFVKEEMCKYCSNPRCIILPIEEMEEVSKTKKTVAQAGINVVYLSEEEIMALYYRGSNALINTIYHEIAHIYQFTKLFNAAHVHPFVIKEIKDFILMKEIESYYSENYENISFEIEAEYYAILNSMNFFDNIGFDCDKEDYNRIMNKVNAKINETKRYVNGKEVDLEILFDEIIMENPKYLEKHPQLNLLYKIEEGLVFPKHRDEMYEDYMNFMEQSNPEDRKIFEKFYEFYIAVSRT